MQSQLLSSFNTIRHIFTTRLDGVSSIPYHSNNLAFHVGDKQNDVIENHIQLAHKLDYDLNKLVHMRQIHSDKIVIIDSEHSFTSPPECDAIITNKKSIPLMVMTADCTPVILYDKVHQVVAAVHAGRAGAFGAIVSKTVKKMQSHFSSEPSDIYAVLGPSIHNCCYEIGKDIVYEAHEQGFEYAVSTRNDHYYLDVNRIIKRQLITASVPEEHIEDLSLCTSCQNEVFFSYRADEQQTGRMAGVIMLADVHAGTELL
ncbi:MAG: peptidoglycan editing factor PgeF [Candidatus Neomarinimicrobiota bacterium]|nr:MAG: peptidoglycan editing factor PgeF [Candidatus Neomarinimicrobiota bacterium]